MLSFARPAERLYLRLDWEGERAELFARATWTGPMDLRRFYNYGGTPRYNLDGTPKLDRSPGFWTVDGSATFKLGSHAQVFLHVSNLFDFKQADREDFLWVDAKGGVDVTHFWGPGRGRAVQAGLRFQY